MEHKVETAIAVVGLMLSLASVAAAAPLAGFALRAETSNFAFYTRRAGSFDVRKTEAQLARVEGALGQQIAGRVDFYAYDRAEDIAAATGRYAGGLTYPGLNQLHATAASHDHEIVHLVAHQLGEPGAFFQEGLAVVLGDLCRWNHQPVDRVAKRIAKRASITALIASFDSVEPGEGYAVAGSFVSFLIKQHGLDRMASFFRGCQGGHPNTTAAFSAAFGQSIEDAGAAWAKAL